MFAAVWSGVVALQTVISRQYGLRNCRFKSCPHDHGRATIAAIELLLKGFAGARNQLYLEFTWTAA
jgi:hypothetical protein